MLQLEPAQVGLMVEIDYQIIHAVPGRLRVRIPRLKSDEDFTHKLCWLLKTSPQVLEVRLNLPISNLIIHYSSHQISLATIEAQLFDLMHQSLKKDLPLPVRSHELEPRREINHLEKLVLPFLGLAIAIPTAIIEFPPLFFGGTIIIIAAIPLFISTLKQIQKEQKLTLDVMESLWTILHTLEGHLIAPALALSFEGTWTVLRDQTASPVDYHAINLRLEGVYTHVKRGGKEEQVLIKEVQIGEQVVVYPGDRIPVDGEILKGKATIDQHKLTGCPDVVVRHPGQKVYAATLVMEGKLTILAEKTGSDTQLGKIIHLIKHAPVHDTRIADFAEDVGNITILPILFLSWTLFATTGNINQALALLQLDFATGIRLSSATAVLTAIARAVKYGVYIRNGHTLEMLARVDTVVFDKTGTLTQIHSEVVDIHTIDDHISPLEVLSLAAAVEGKLNHPYSQAIVHFAEQKNVLNHVECESWEYKIGQGIIAQINGEQILVGSKKFFRKAGIKVKALRHKHHSLKHSGHTHVYVAKNHQLLGVICLNNPIRPESIEVISQLKTKGIESYILTGDHPKAALKIAQQVNIEASNIYSDVFPDQKVEVLKQLDEEGRIVAYIGDGLNDGAGLAYADVSVSFAEGSHTARQTAQVVLINNNLQGLMIAITIAKQAMSAVYQNIGLISFPNVSVALAGLMLGLDPIMAVMVNSGFMTLAELNGLRPLLEVIETPQAPKSQQNQLS